MSFYCVFAMSANAAKSDFFCWVYLRTILDYNVASNYIKYLIWQIRRHAYYCSCTIRTKVYEAIMICNLKAKNYFQIIKWYIFHIGITSNDFSNTYFCVLNSLWYLVIVILFDWPSESIYFILWTPLVIKRFLFERMTAVSDLSFVYHDIQRTCWQSLMLGFNNCILVLGGIKCLRIYNKKYIWTWE